MTSILTLILVGIVESCVFVWRYRAVHARKFAHTALSTAAVCTCRVLFVAAGVSAILKDIHIAAAIAAYAIPAAILSGWLDSVSKNERHAK